MNTKKNSQPTGVQEWAYEARKGGESWHEISLIIGGSERKAYKAAWKHAKIHSLQWPLPDPEMTPGFRWTQNDKQKLIQGYAAGVPVSDLSRDLKRSDKAIYAKAKYMGLRHASLTKLSSDT